MSPERWRQLKEICGAVLDHTPEQRAAVVAQLCANDNELKRDVEAMLDQATSRGSILSRPIWEELKVSFSLIGQQLSQYKITEKIGSGGMGEVYRARDTKLKRGVAIKVLPDEFSRDADRVSRFQREAQVLASLNHTNIAAIYDLQETGDSCYLVLELVEGETLQHRLRRGPLPLDEALSVARQICHALASAHEKGVVHLDLKPANVMMTSNGRVKLLDFGLASMLRSEATTHDLWNQLTVTGTREGVIAGTPAYMSPEQARGKPVDKRTDMWAFGCVLYEMLTGRQLFSAETVTDILAAIVAKEPDLSALPSAVPLQVRLLLKHCLQKDLDLRFRDASDAVALLNSAEPPASAPATKRRSWIPLAAMAIAIIGVAALVPAFLYFRSPVPTSRLTRFEIPMPAPAILFSIAVSPDGRRVAYVAPNDGKPALWVRSLDSLNAQVVPGTEGHVNIGCQPFWSPEGRFIGFESDRKLKKIDISGGPPQTLTDLDVNCIGGGTWNRDGVIVFASNEHGLRRVSASGGEAVEISERDKSLDEIYHDNPWFLPDGRHFLYLAWSQNKPENRAIYIGSLDSKTRTRLMTANSNAMYAPPGFLLYMREGTLLARPFDAKRLAFTGQEQPVAEQVNMDPSNEIGAFSVSEEGTLIYRKKTIYAGDRELVWFHRDGKPGEVVGSPLQTTGTAIFSLSRDGQLVAFSAVTPGTSGTDIFVEDIERNVRTRLTTDPATDHNPVWSPDSSQLVFDSHRTSSNASASPAGPQVVSALYVKTVTGASPESMLLPPEPGFAVGPRDWSSDGRYILFTKSPTAQPPWDIWVLPLFGDKKPFPFAATPFDENQPTLSPNGRWLAYVSNEPGSNEVFVQPFPDGTRAKWQISTEGGAYPRWSRDGHGLFYMDPKGRLFVVPVKTDGNFEIGKASPLFDTRLGSASPYEVSADGQRFLMGVPRRGSEASPPITVHLNWAAALKP
jgi:serine/threonine protein kinase/Tol biopolymer transport system component